MEWSAERAGGRRSRRETPETFGATMPTTLRDGGCERGGGDYAAREQRVWRGATAGDGARHVERVSMATTNAAAAAATTTTMV